LIQLQAVEHGAWKERARSMQEQTLDQPARRGTIYDSGGLVLAVDVKAKSIAIDGRNATEPEELIDILRDELRRPIREIRELVLRPSYFTWIARRVDLDVAERIAARAEDAGAFGLIFVDTWKRYYPQGTLASNLLGFVGVDGEGLEGLELFYDDRLRGTPGAERVVEGRDGRPYDVETLQPAIPGRDVHLTIDARVQAVCERAVDRGVARHDAVAGFCLVLDPHTGALLAMAQCPRYDPNAFGAADPEARRNLAVTTQFEPGSTFKAFTALAALNAGVASPGERFNGDDGLLVSGHTMHNAGNESHGSVTFTEIIERSINTGMIRIAQRAGSEALHDTFAALGFGRPTGVDLPGELTGILRPAEDWVPLDLAAASIGQSVAVTGIQLACAISAIAGDGTVPVPHLTAAGRSPDDDLNEVASSATLITLRGMLQRVVESGTGTWAQIAGYDIAGKTGTAQKALPGRGYVAGKYTSLFAGFLPASNPELVCLVVLDEVHSGPQAGGYTAGQIFREAMTHAVTLLEIPPATR
jgi:cell division protein FtsI/penicillin-binding protein 2